MMKMCTKLQIINVFLPSKAILLNLNKYMLLHMITFYGF